MRWYWYEIATDIACLIIGFGDLALGAPFAWWQAVVLLFAGIDLLRAGLWFYCQRRNNNDA